MVAVAFVLKIAYCTFARETLADAVMVAFAAVRVVTIERGFAPGVESTSVEITTFAVPVMERGFPLALELTSNIGYWTFANAKDAEPAPVATDAVGATTLDEITKVVAVALAWKVVLSTLVTGMVAVAVVLALGATKIILLDGAVADAVALISVRVTFVVGI